LWWEGRTTKLHVGKFEIQHGHVVSEFQQT